MLVKLNNRVSDLEYDTSVLAIYNIKGKRRRKGMRRVQADVSFHPVMDVSDIVWNINAVIACTRTL